MARLPALIDDLGMHDPRGRSAVETIARLIREAGLMRTTKRGRGAAEMSPADAAALIIALCVGENAISAAQSAEVFAALSSQKVTVEAEEALRELGGTFMALATPGSLKHALVDLLSDPEGTEAVMNRLIALRYKRAPLGEVKRGEIKQFFWRVNFNLTEISAEISASWIREDGVKRHASINFGQTDVKRDHHLRMFDRNVSVAVRGETFERVGRLLQGALHLR